MEPIDDWMEAELQRNDMQPKKTLARIGAAEVAFNARVAQREAALAVPPDYQHPEHAYEEPEYFLTGELYSPPSPLNGISKVEAERITSELVNVLATVDLLNDQRGAQASGPQVESDCSKDMVTLPEHYARFPIEPVRFSVENNLNFFQANIVKYILRYDAKNGMEDLKKARRYIDMFIKWVEGDPDWWRK
jgi:hypothetical protein